MTTIDPARPRTAHFVERQRQRHIPDTLVELAVSFGAKFHQGDARVYFLGRKHLDAARRRRPLALSERDARRADGTVVVLGVDNCLITTYRNPDYIRHLRRRA